MGVQDVGQIRGGDAKFLRQGLLTPRTLHGTLQPLEEFSRRQASGHTAESTIIMRISVTMNEPPLSSAWPERVVQRHDGQLDAIEDRTQRQRRRGQIIYLRDEPANDLDAAAQRQR